MGSAVQQRRRCRAFARRPVRPASVGAVLEVRMTALTAVRHAPVRAAVRLQTVRAGEREAGMATAEYAVATAVT